MQTDHRPEQAPTTDLDNIERPKWLSRGCWPFTLRRLQYQHRDGRELDLHYTDEGEGPVIVFVHAGMWSFIWRDVIAMLATRYRCISLDFPGTGLSAGRPTDVDLSEFPSMVSALFDHCRIEDATLVVHDLGGVVGVCFADEHPERVNALIAVNSFAWPPEQRSLRTMLSVMGSRPMTAVVGTLRLIPRLSRTRMGVGRHMDVAARRGFFGPYRRRSYARNFHRAMRSASRSKELFDRADRALATTLDHLDVMTVFGEKNDPFGFGDRWRSYFPSASGWVVPEGNHFPMCDDPHEFCARVDEFLGWPREHARGPNSLE